MSDIIAGPFEVKGLDRVMKHREKYGVTWKLQADELIADPTEHEAWRKKLYQSNYPTLLEPVVDSMMCEDAFPEKLGPVPLTLAPEGKVKPLELIYQQLNRITGFVCVDCMDVLPRKDDCRGTLTVINDQLWQTYCTLGAEILKGIINSRIAMYRANKSFYVAYHEHRGLYTRESMAPKSILVNPSADPKP